ncbi:TPA: bestrophin family ion channel, partial [Escherichia coli]
MIVRPQQHWLRRIFVWHGSVLSKISSRLLLNFLFSIAVIFMLPWYTHLGIKFTLAPFSILGVAIAIFGVVCGRGRNPTLRLWPTIFSGKIDVFPGDRRSRLISSMTSVAP